MSHLNSGGKKMRLYIEYPNNEILNLEGVIDNFENEYLYLKNKNEFWLLDEKTNQDNIEEWQDQIIYDFVLSIKIFEGEFNLEGRLNEIDRYYNSKPYDELEQVLKGYCK